MKKFIISWVILFVTAWVFLAMATNTQQVASVVSTSPIPVKPGLFDGIKDAAIEIGTAVVIGLFGLVFGFVQLKLKEKTERGINDPVQILSGEKRNSIILIGLAETGKTTFINSLLGITDKVTRTKKYELHEGQKVVPTQTNGRTISTTYRFYISDYIGQNIGTLISAFIWQQKSPFSPMAYGHINSLILMVDLIEPDSVRGRPDPKRIKRHLDQWNDTALDAVWGLLRKESMRYVCLFINKVDAMTDNSPEAQNEYRQLYCTLCENIARRVKAEQTQVEFQVILGSAQMGVAVVDAKLQQHSVNSDFKPTITEDEHRY